MKIAGCVYLRVGDTVNKGELLTSPEEFTPVRLILEMNLILGGSSG